MKRILAGIALLFVAGFSGGLRANTVALDFTGGHDFSVGGLPPNDITLGWAFTLNQPVLLTDLGIYDGRQFTGFTSPPGSVGDGLVQSHIVSLWTGTGNLVATTIIPSGTNATLVGAFRYVSVAPTVLAAGSYIIGAEYIGANITDTSEVGASTVTTAPELTYDGQRVTGGNSVPFGPGLGPADNKAYFGPNFQFTHGSIDNGNSVPESGNTLLLTAIAVSPLWLIRRKLAR